MKGIQSVHESPKDTRRSLKPATKYDIRFTHHAARRRAVAARVDEVVQSAFEVERRNPLGHVQRHVHHALRAFHKGVLLHGNFRAEFRLIETALVSKIRAPTAFIWLGVPPFSVTVAASDVHEICAGSTYFTYVDRRRAGYIQPRKEDNAVSSSRAFLSSVQARAIMSLGVAVKAWLERTTRSAITGHPGATPLFRGIAPARKPKTKVGYIRVYKIHARFKQLAVPRTGIYLSPNSPAGVAFFTDMGRRSWEGIAWLSVTDDRITESECVWIRTEPSLAYRPRLPSSCCLRMSWLPSRVQEALYRFRAPDL